MALTRSVPESFASTNMLAYDDSRLFMTLAIMFKIMRRALILYLNTGYITVDEQHGRKLYYYFATSEKDPRGDPVVLWCDTSCLACGKA